MQIMEHVYFNFFTIGALIPALFMSLLAYFFVKIRNKSKATVHFSISLIYLSIFYWAYFFAFSFYHPLTAFHRWFTVAVVLIAILHFGLIIFYYPDDRRPRFGKAYMIAGYAISAVVVLFFFYESFFADKVYHFAGHYWDFDAERASKIVGIAILLILLAVPFIGVWRTIVNKGVERWAALTMSVVLFIGIFIPSITNFLSRDGLLDRGTYQISQNLSTLTAFFIISIIYINTTRDRSNFMSKVIIVTSATLLILVQGFSYFSLQDQERSFDELLAKETRINRISETYSSDMEYVVSFSADELSVSPEYYKNDKVPDIDFERVGIEFHNTYIYEKIRELDKNRFMERLSQLLAETDPRFSGYKAALLEYASRISEDAEDPARELLEYVDSIERPVLFTKTKIRRLAVDNFRENLKEFLPSARSQIFNDVILTHLKETESDHKKLKDEILEYLAPFRSAGSRIYRKDAADENHYVAVMDVNLKQNKVIEAGFPYLKYRSYVHDTSQKYIVMLLIMVLVIFAGFPLFFWGSLIKPIRNLLSGLRKIQQGNLKVQIPVRVEDEFGFMSRTFNTMADEIRSATENLEGKVNARTEELRAAMEEMEAINEQLLETRDALWGEMELAKKIQMKLLPEDPAIADYEITAFMEPADEVGGDYYDVINVAGMDWVVIGDVSGHGVPAGLVMMMAQTAIHVALDQNPDIPPDRLLEVVNKTISKNIKMLGEDKYMTITVLAASKGGRFIFSGLHQDIMVYRASTGRVDLVETRGMWIGIVDDLKGMLEVDSLTMEPGDVMFLYSDGITEARRKDYEKGIETEEFGEERLLEFFRNHAGLPVYDIKSALLKELEEYRCGDDITMVFLRRKA